MACDLKKLTLDKEASPSKVNFQRARRAENRYARRLRQIAEHIGSLTEAVYVPSDFDSARKLEGLLKRYADTLDPWARAVGLRMVTEVEARERKQWADISRAIGKGLRRELESTPVGGVIRSRMEEQVTLIKSLPLDAAKRVHELTLEAAVRSTRASEIAQEIMRSGKVSESRAMLIARTEVSRTATELTKARAERVGSTHFIWRTAGDSDVRPTHKALNGKVFRWDDPPECDPGYHALPGGIWNCRCWPEPVISD
ncbi:phage minor head protein [Azorhizobium caulinodans]|uniref:phage head morphogenesis protein n=1 Tax=Azorhizobium caulinodans TaxID=7 RepID=UPI002FBE75C3